MTRRFWLSLNRSTLQQVDPETAAKPGNNPSGCVFSEMDQNVSELQFSLSLPNREESVAVGGCSIAEAASHAGLLPREVTSLRLAVEEALHNSVHHAYSPKEHGIIKIEAYQTPRGVRVDITDQGIPFKPIEEWADHHVHGWSRMMELADAVTYHNLGRKGKSIEIHKYRRSEALDPQESEGKPAATASHAEEEIEIRLTKPEDISQICRSIYRTYGYSYDHDVIYYPEQFQEMIEAGLVISAVAVTPQGKVVGHAGLSLDTKESIIANMGMSVVDPAYRATGIGGKLGYVLTKTARAKGLQGLFSMAVTAHTFSQKAIHKGNFHDCGLILGFTPAFTSFRGIREKLVQRESLVLAYKPLEQGETLPIYAPAAHKDIIESLLEPVMETRDFRTPDGSEEIPEATDFSVEVSTERGQGVLNFVTLGQDAEAVLFERLKHLKLQKVDIIVLKADLHSPHLPKLAEVAESLGFFFSGVLPKWRREGALLMTYLNNIDIDGSKLNFDSEVGQKLLTYINECRKKTELSLPQL